MQNSKAQTSLRITRPGSSLFVNIVNSNQPNMSESGQENAGIRSLTWYLAVSI